MSGCDSQNNSRDTRALLLELYSRLANEPATEFGWGKGKENARALGYSEKWLDRLSDKVWESAAAVGNPFSLGPIHAGETVVDIGCGAGADACVAALLVGDQGKVIGIDCTPAMIEKATGSAIASGLKQVICHQAEITALPLPNACADVVISNGAVNLAEDKNTVLGEIFRVLRPGGRLQIADMVRAPTEDHTARCNSEESWADCISGTLEPNEFLSLLTQIGFVNVELTDFTGYKTAVSTVGALVRAKKPR